MNPTDPVTRAALLARADATIGGNALESAAETVTAADAAVRRAARVLEGEQTEHRLRELEDAVDELVDALRTAIAAVDIFTNSTSLQRRDRRYFSRCRQEWLRLLKHYAGRGAGGHASD